MSKVERKPIRGFPDYEVTSEADVINLRSGKKLTPSPSRLGYLYVTLYKDKTPVKVGLQILVAKAFVPGRTKVKNRVLFRNHKKTDCRADNLKWGTHQEACEQGLTGTKQLGESNPNNKLKIEQVVKMREIYDNGGINQRDLATQFNVSFGTVQKIMANKIWTQPDAYPKKKTA